MNKQEEILRCLVGNVDVGQLRYVDCFIASHLALFMPVGGACFYAQTKHSHPAYMFVLPFDDQTNMELDGKIITARHGRLFSLSPNIVHQELPTDFPPRYIAIFIGKEFFDNQLRQYPRTRNAVFRGESHNTAPDLLLLLKKFMIEANLDVPGTKAILDALALQICHTIIRSIFDFTSQQDNISSRLEINRAIEYLHSYIDKKITIEKLAEIAYMSQSHFSRIFKKETGNSPMDYLSKIRLKRAKKLLLAGDKTITEIAYECGFSSSAYLSSRFLKKFKMAPSTYKKSMISKEKGKITKD